jgi:hypothetical protein
MEDILDVYTQERHENRPLVCMDECPKQLIGETRIPLPAKPGKPGCFDTEYVRNGTCDIFMFVAPLEGWRRAEITEAYAGRTVFAILDNAKYQKCNVTGELAEQTGINLVFIPPYSPNLNLIERLWKFVKGKLRSRYYDRFELFREQIDSIINSAENHNKESADRLIGEKVQLFDDLIAINENSFMCNKEAA